MIYPHYCSTTSVVSESDHCMGQVPIVSCTTGQYLDIIALAVALIYIIGEIQTLLLLPKDKSKGTCVRTAKLAVVHCR